jgi:lysophospholipase
MGDGAQPAAARGEDMVLIPGNPPPADAEIIWYKGEDGIRLRMLFAPISNSGGCGARALAIVCPGRTESIEKYFETMRDLQSRNFAIVCFDWPGQGLSDRPLKNPIRGHVTTFDTYVDALCRGLNVITDRAPKTHIIVAHSMGSAIALEAMRTERLKVALAAFSAPMWGIPATPFLQNFARMANKLGLATFPARPETRDDVFEGNPFTHDERRWGLYRRLKTADPRLALGEPTIGWVVASLDVCAGFFVPGALEKLALTPMMVATATEDTVVDPTAAARLVPTLPGAKLVPIEGARHEIFMETDERRAAWFKAFDELCAKAGI